MPHQASSGEAIASMERLADQLPQGYVYEWSGQTRQEIEAGNPAPPLLALAVLLVFAPGRPVRELDHSFLGDCRGAPGDLWCDGRALHYWFGEQYLRSGGDGTADWIVDQNGNSDRRICHGIEA